MAEHEWLTPDEIQAILFALDPGWSDDRCVKRILLDLSAAKSLLRECSGYMRYRLIVDPCGRTEKAEKDAAEIYDRLLAVPGVQASKL